MADGAPNQGKLAGAPPPVSDRMVLTSSSLRLLARTVLALEQVRPLGLRALLGGDVADLEDDADDAAVPAQRAGRVGHRKKAAVATDEHVFATVRHSPFDRAGDRALGHGVRAPVGSRVVNGLVERAVAQLRERVPDHLLCGGIQVGAAVLLIGHEEAERRVARHGLELVTQRLALGLRAFSLGDVAALAVVRRSNQGRAVMGTALLTGANKGIGFDPTRSAPAMNAPILDLDA